MYIINGKHSLKPQTANSENPF